MVDRCAATSLTPGEPPTLDVAPPPPSAFGARGHTLFPHPGLRTGNSLGTLNGCYMHRPFELDTTAQGGQVRIDQRGTVIHPTIEQPADIVARLRATFRSGRTKPVEWRTTQLRRLREMLTDARRRHRTSPPRRPGQELHRGLPHRDRFHRPRDRPHPGPPRRVAAARVRTGPRAPRRRRDGLDAVRPPGRRPGHRPLELPGPAPADAATRRAGLRQRRRGQAQRAGPRHLRRHGPAPAAVPRHRRGRRRRRRRPGDHRAARRALRPHLLHRQRRRRAHRDAGRRRAPHPGHARTGRQVPGVRRPRTPTCPRSPHRLARGQVPQRRPDLRRARLRSHRSRRPPAPWSPRSPAPSRTSSAPTRSTPRSTDGSSTSGTSTGSAHCSLPAGP